MPQSLAMLYIHTIFSTKNRVACLNASVRNELKPYLATVVRSLDCLALRVGGTADHVHILCGLSKNFSVAKFVEEVKKPSSQWLKTKGEDLRQFHWQAGYGAFSVSQSHVNRVCAYIDGQEEHHKTVTFQDEFRRFLRRYKVEFDERYVWD